MSNRTPTDPALVEQGHLVALATLTDRLAARGWTVERSKKGIRARWRWLRIDVRHRPRRPEAPWRVRVRDGMPRTTVYASRAASPEEAAKRGADYALRVVELCSGSGLFANPSKEDLAHRLWQAVRPF